MINMGWNGCSKKTCDSLLRKNNPTSSMYPPYTIFSYVIMGHQLASLVLICLSFSAIHWGYFTWSSWCVKGLCWSKITLIREFGVNYAQLMSQVQVWMGFIWRQVLSNLEQFSRAPDFFTFCVASAGAWEGRLRCWCVCWFMICSGGYHLG